MNRSAGKICDRSPDYLMKTGVERSLESEKTIEAERPLMNERWKRFALTGEALDHSEILAWIDALPWTGDEPSYWQSLNGYRRRLMIYSVSMPL